MPYYYAPNVGYNQGVMPNQTPQNNGLNWVQGETGAKSFLVAPGNTVLLMDSEAELFYIKSADASGMPMPLRVFEYKEVGAAQKPTEYVTRKEYDDLIDKYNGIVDYLNDKGGRNYAEPAIQPTEQKPADRYDGADHAVHKPEQRPEPARRSEPPARIGKDKSGRI